MKKREQFEVKTCASGELTRPRRMLKGPRNRQDVLYLLWTSSWRHIVKSEASMPILPSSNLPNADSPIGANDKTKNEPKPQQRGDEDSVFPSEVILGSDALMKIAKDGNDVGSQKTELHDEPPACTFFPLPTFYEQLFEQCSCNK